MSLICVGLNHQKAPMGLLDKAKLTQEDMERLAVDLVRDGVASEAIALKTCNRMEFYIKAPEDSDPSSDILGQLLANSPSSYADALRAATFVLHDEGAADHLFRVAAGIDSLIVGEAQILGQLRNAFQAARTMGTSGENLNALFQAAINFGRRVRMETSIGRGNVSVASIACRLAVEQLDDLAGKRLLLVGAGETARLAGRHFLKEKIGSITVVNRTHERASALAAELCGEALEIDSLGGAIASADIIICATGSPDHLITPENLASASVNRGNTPLILIDLSMPANISPETGKVPGVILFSLGNLEEIARRNRELRESEITSVERMVRKETRKYLQWASSSHQNQLAATFRRHIASIHDRVSNRYLGDTPDAEREKVDRFTDSLLRATFHDVTEHIRNLDIQTEEGRRDLETIRRIFRLDEPAIPSSSQTGRLDFG